MYINEKMLSTETIPGIGERGDKREWGGVNSSMI
jgi:hypothetical protein